MPASTFGNRLGSFVDRFEEVAIALLLALMTLLTFINVVLRYVFNDSIIWGLEVTLVLFAWLVMFGVSHCVKTFSHLGVDFIITRVGAPIRRLIGLAACGICLAYAFLLVKGSWDYWAPFAGLYETTGHWFPTGFDWNTRDRAWYETVQIPMLDFLRFFEPLVNQGESYEKLPRFIPYVIMPLGSLLLLFRLVQATILVVRGNRDSIIVSHEVEDELASVETGARN